MTRDASLLPLTARTPSPLIVDGRPGPRFLLSAGHTAEMTRCSNLDPEALNHLVDTVAALRGTSNRPVAASLWMSQCASWIASPVVAQRLHDQILRAPLSAVRLRVYGGVIQAATFSEPPYAGVGDIAADDETMLTDLIDRNLSVLASRLRTQIRISSRTLSGNIAAAIATGTRVMSWCATPDDQVADASFAAAFALRLLRRRNLDHLCDVGTQTVEDRSWLVVQRRSCCLAYRTPVASYCATCPLISRSERTERHRRMILDHIQESP